MKKFVSMIMAAALIFALAVPAFAAKVDSTIKATMQTPKVALTVGKVSVVANPYRIAVKDPTGGDDPVRAQIVSAPVACVNKSDVGLNIGIVITPTKNNNVKWVADVADGKVKDAETNNPVPGACLTFSAAVDATDYSSETTAPSNWTYVIPLQGTSNITAAGTVDTENSENNTSYSKVTAGKMDTMTLTVPGTTSGNSVWFKVEGTLNTDADWATWVDGSKKPACIEFTVSFIMTPVANTVTGG